jgi:hypothetical protein
VPFHKFELFSAPLARGTAQFGFHSGRRLRWKCALTPGRYATLTALVLELTATLIDEALNMFEHLVGQMFKKSERAHAEQFHANGKSINEKVRLYARVGQVLIEARSTGGDVFAAIQSVLPWPQFESTVAEA